MVRSLALFWTQPGRNERRKEGKEGKEGRRDTKDKNPKETKKDQKTEKNPKNRKMCKTFPRPKNAQNSRQNTFAQLFGHRDLEWRPGCATEEKCAKRPFLTLKNRPFWTPDSGPRDLPDAQNRLNFISRLDTSQLRLQWDQLLKK